ncbi:MAG: FKBP-type peptidyl-prolyl cis-trans isomerase, partial [bacterium]
MAKAKSGDTVRVHYKGVLKDGTVFDSSEGSDPLEFTLGEGRVIPGFESAVEGMEEGESKNISVPHQEAYGDYRDDLAVQVEKERLPEDIKPEVGMILQVPSQQGTPVRVTVTDVSEATIT